jgi:hypothetical protein
MAILNVDLTDVRGLTKMDARAAFERWKEQKCPSPNTFSFEGGEEIIAGKKRRWSVVSWGDYQDASGHYRRFISYRCGVGSLSRVFSWVWDDEGKRWNECSMQGFGSW